MSWKPLANVSQKSFRHFLLISEITFAPVKGVVPVLLLKDHLISEHTSVPRGSTWRATRVIPDSPVGKTHEKRRQVSTSDPSQV